MNSHWLALFIAGMCSFQQQVFPKAELAATGSDKTPAQPCLQQAQESMEKQKQDEEDAPQSVIYGNEEQVQEVAMDEEERKERPEMTEDSMDIEGSLRTWKENFFGGFHSFFKAESSSSVSIFSQGICSLMPLSKSNMVILLSFSSPLSLICLDSKCLKPEMRKNTIVREKYPDSMAAKSG